MQKHVNLVDLVKSFQRIFTCKNRRRYSRERAPRSLGEIIQYYSFVSLIAGVPVVEPAHEQAPEDRGGRPPERPGGRAATMVIGNFIPTRS